MGVVALLQQDDAFDDVVVVDELAIFLLDNGLALFVHLLDAGVGSGGGVGFSDRGCACAAGLADLAEADLGTLDDCSDVFDSQGGARSGS